MSAPYVNSSADRRTFDADTSTSFFPGSTDMVKTWSRLGFVAKIELPGVDEPVWIEQEREMPRGFVPADS